MVSETSFRQKRNRLLGAIRAVPAWLMVKAVSLYQLVISPLLGPRCRFYPTCSCYTRAALEQHGFLKGLVLSTWRVLRCHPWSGTHWHDPVPKRFAWRDIFGYKRIDKSEIKQ